MEYKTLTISQLVVDPTNYRGVYDGIDSLACSIRDHGLLHNIVAYPRNDGKYVVRAGNRRVLAISKLVDDGEWSIDSPIMTLIDDGGSFTDIIENLHREDVPMWRTGFRFIELMEGGLTQLEVAGRANVSNGTVSNYISVARGLHPELISRLERMGHRSINKTQVIAISKCVGDDQEPILAEQLSLLEKFMVSNVSRRLGRKGRRKPRENLSQKDLVFYRFQKLDQDWEKVPPEHQRVVDCVLRFLKGESRHLEFK